jgi:ATP/maltotriose-dependent transcriptional regulator MalT
LTQLCAYDTLYYSLAWTGDIQGPTQERIMWLQQVIDDGVPHPSAEAPRPIVQPLREPLSERELEILRLIVAGCSNREIADRLVIALSTVKCYVNTIYAKLQVESRTKAIAHARELNIV